MRTARTANPCSGRNCSSTLPRVEVPVARVVGVDRVERVRPIEAVRTRFERPTPAAAVGGQEDGVAVQTGH